MKLSYQNDDKLGEFLVISGDKSIKTSLVSSDVLEIETKECSDIFSSIMITTGLGSITDAAVSYMKHDYHPFVPHILIGRDGDVIQLIPLNRTPILYERDVNGKLFIHMLNPGRMIRVSEYTSIDNLGLPHNTEQSIKDDDNNAWIPYTTDQIMSLWDFVTTMKSNGYLKKNAPVTYADTTFDDLCITLHTGPLKDLTSSIFL